jgi:two-component system OmpR family sensor kinase
MSTLPLRRRLILAAAGTVAVALALVTVGFNVVLTNRLDRDAANVVRSRAQSGAALVNAEGNHLVVEETPVDSALDERVWVFEGSRAIRRVSSDPAAQAAAASLARGPAPAQLDLPNDTRLQSRAIQSNGRRLGTVVATVSLVPYEHTAQIALISSLVLDALVMLAVLLIAGAVVTRALMPVAEMTTQAADWSEHDLDRRFAMGPARDELTALAATLDGLMGRLSASLRHEKRFSAEMAHELRTPLATLRAEAELALEHARDAREMRESLEIVLRQSERMSSVIETLMTAAQRAADSHTGTVDAREAAHAAVEACAARAHERGLLLSVRPSPETIEVDADGSLTAQLLVPLIENALNYGRSRVTVGYAHEGEVVVFRVSDDGPGVSEDEAEAIFNPGTRGSAANGHPGAGLGLALVRRLARTAGGDVAAEPSTGGGSFAVRLPAS